MNGIVNIARRQASSSGGAAPANPDFVTVWNVASDGETLTLPLESGGTFSGTIDWGDTNTSALSYANRQHTYTTAGTYTITISGETLQGWAFKNTGDKLKITDVSNWGTIFEFDRTRMFQGCANMDVSATDIPTISTTDMTSNFYQTGITNPDWSGWNVSAVTNYSLCFMLSSNFNGNIGNWVTSATTNISSMLNACSSFNKDLSGWNTSAVTDAQNLLANADAFNGDVSNWTLNGTWYRPFNGCDAFTGTGVDTWDTSGLTDARNLFVNCVVFNGDISGWNTSSLTNISNMLFNCDAFDQDLSSWDVTAITTATGFMQSAAGLSTANYDALLISWAAQSVNTGVSISFGTSLFTAAPSDAATAKSTLQTTYSWIISDGGSV
jgi:surface protein